MEKFAHIFKRADRMAGVELLITTSFDLSKGQVISREVYATKPEAKKAAKAANAKPWNY